MTAYRPNLSPLRVHSSLKKSLGELRQAERNAVLWFGEVMSRKLYLGVGCSSIQQYAEVKLGFSKSKTSQFIRLCGALETLPQLKQSVSAGELSWTKAREVAKVATLETESLWVARAKKSSNRELEIKVSQVIKRARANRCQDKNQVVLGDRTGTGGLGLVVSTDQANRPEIASSINGVPPGGNPGAEIFSSRADPEYEVPVTLQVRLTPEQYACYESLMEKLRKQGHKETRAELLLAGLERMVLSRVDDATRSSAETDCTDELSGSSGGNTSRWDSGSNSNPLESIPTRTAGSNEAGSKACAVAPAELARVNPGSGSRDRSKEFTCKPGAPVSGCSTALREVLPG